MAAAAEAGRPAALERGGRGAAHARRQRRQPRHALLRCQALSGLEASPEQSWGFRLRDALLRCHALGVPQTL